MKIMIVLYIVHKLKAQKLELTDNKRFCSISKGLLIIVAKTIYLNATGVDSCKFVGEILMTGIMMNSRFVLIS